MTPTHRAWTARRRYLSLRGAVDPALVLERVRALQVYYSARFAMRANRRRHVQA